MKSVICIILFAILIVSPWFIPEIWLEKVLISPKFETSISDLITVMTFLAGFILLILPMKVNDSQLKNTVRRQLQVYLIRRNRFLTVLFFLFLIELFLLFILPFFHDTTLLRITLILLEVLILAIIRLFFLIREYVEYTE